MVDDNENKAGGAEGRPVGGESREGRGGRNDRRGGGYGARRWRCPDPSCGKYNSGIKHKKGIKGTVSVILSGRLPVE